MLNVSTWWDISTICVSGACRISMPLAIATEASCRPKSDNSVTQGMSGQM
jgi:hypothetical protein